MANGAFFCVMQRGTTATKHVISVHAAHLKLNLIFRTEEITNIFSSNEMCLSSSYRSYTPTASVGLLPNKISFKKSFRGQLCRRMQHSII